MQSVLITSNNYYTKYLSEYGLTLKIYLPDRLIKILLIIYMLIIASTEQINLVQDIQILLLMVLNYLMVIDF